MDDDERLRLEYEQAVQVVRSLTDVRFKLLAFVPTTAGAVVALVSPGSSGVELLAIGLLGLAATLGVLVYELRNAQLSRAATLRIGRFEASAFPGGPLAVEPRSVGPVALTHSLALGLVYGCALGGWAYLVAWGALRAGSLEHARSAGLVIGAAVAVLAVAGVLRLEGGRRDDAPERAPLPRGST
jgi:hypothetical protein